MKAKFFTLAVRIVFGLTKPKNTILGYELSGEVEAAGMSIKGTKRGMSSLLWRITKKPRK
jgi:hypothetical protein